MPFQYVITQEMLYSCNRNALDDWVYQARNDFYATLANKNFPCLFALNAFYAKGIIFLFVGTAQNLLLNGLIEYTEFCKNTPIKHRITKPLVVFFSQQYDTLQQEQLFAWEQIQFLHDNDIKSYPSHIP